MLQNFRKPENFGNETKPKPECFPSPLQRCVPTGTSTVRQDLKGGARSGASLESCTKAFQPGSVSATQKVLVVSYTRPPPTSEPSHFRMTRCLEFSYEFILLSVGNQMDSLCGGWMRMVTVGSTFASQLVDCLGEDWEMCPCWGKWHIGWGWGSKAHNLPACLSVCLSVSVSLPPPLCFLCMRQDVISATSQAPHLPMCCCAPCHDDHRLTF